MALKGARIAIHIARQVLARRLIFTDCRPNKLPLHDDVLARRHEHLLQRVHDGDGASRRDRIEDANGGDERLLLQLILLLFV